MTGTNILHGPPRAFEEEDEEVEIEVIDVRTASATLALCRGI